MERQGLDESLFENLPVTEAWELYYPNEWPQLEAQESLHTIYSRRRRLQRKLLQVRMGKREFLRQFRSQVRDLGYIIPPGRLPQGVEKSRVMHEAQQAQLLSRQQQAQGSFADLEQMILEMRKSSK